MSLRFPLCLLAAAALQPSASAAIHSSEAPAAQTSARLATARQLIELIYPRDVAIANHVREWEARAIKTIGRSAGGARLEEKYPGVTRAGIDAARGLAEQYCARFVDRAIERKTEILAARLDMQDLEVGLDFFGSSAGRHLMREVRRSVDASGIAAEMAGSVLETGEVAASSDAVVPLRDHVVHDLVEKASAEDRAAILLFAEQPAAARVLDAVLAGEAEVLEMARDLDSEWLRQQREVARAAMIKFIFAK